jgi:hypothetical protein
MRRQDSNSAGNFRSDSPLLCPVYKIEQQLSFVDGRLSAAEITQSAFLDN